MKNKRFVTNTDIFKGGICKEQVERMEQEDQETDSDDVQIVEQKKLQPVTKNDIKLVSLMALELKLEFDKTFTNYKDNVTNFKEFMGDDEHP